MVSPEQPSHEIELSELDARRREIAVEQGQFSGVMAQAAELGYWPERPIEPNESKSTPVSDRRAHYSRRGGRAYSEMSGRDIARQIANADTTPRAEDQEEIDERGLALARRTILPNIYARLEREADGDEVRLRALVRAWSERKERERRKPF